MSSPIKNSVISSSDGIKSNLDWNRRRMKSIVGDLQSHSTVLDKTINELESSYITAMTNAIRTAENNIAAAKASRF